MKKKILLSLVCLLLITGCGDVELKDGEKAIVTFKEGAISSDDFYEELKELYGSSSITNLIDKYLLEQKYETSQDEKDYIKQTIKTVKQTAKDSGVNLDTYLNVYYGYSDIDAFEKQLSLNYKRNLWVSDYAKESVNDKQLKEYYENEVYGDIEASDILITINANNNDTDEDKKKAEETALNTAKEVIEKLKKGGDYADLAKKYSKDSTTSNNGGSLGKVNKTTVSSEVFSALVNMKNGSYSLSPVKSSDGYHILFRTSQDEKPKLDDKLTDEIKTIIGSEIQKEDGFEAKALKALREQNDMKFIDTTLEKQYEKLN